MAGAQPEPRARDRSAAPEATAQVAAAWAYSVGCSTRLRRRYSIGANRETYAMNENGGLQTSCPQEHSVAGGLPEHHHLGPAMSPGHPRGLQPPCRP